MKVVIPGGSGLLGPVLARALLANGHDVVVLSRNAGAPDPKSPWRIAQWDGSTVAGWAAEIDGADVVINLAGRSVNCRYNAENRRQIMYSRVNSTRAIGAAIAQATRPPRIWLQSSTATIYSHRYDAPNDEATGILGGTEPGAPDTWQFSIDVAKTWERVAIEAQTDRTRQVLMRTAIVMTPDAGGAFDILLGLVRRGLGGRAGDGRQFVSWIHEDDFLAAVNFLIERNDLAGAVNLAAPHPLTNAEFMRDLRHAWGARIGLPATEWMIELGTRLLNTESELVLKSRRVVPGRMLDAGFHFQFPSWPQAAKDLCHRWRERRLADQR